MSVEKTQETALLLGCTALYFVRQANYRHSPYNPPRLQERVAAREAKPRSGAALLRSAHDYDTRL